MAASPKIPRLRPNPNSSLKPASVNGVPSGVRSPATRPAAVARPPRPVVPTGPVGHNAVPPTSRNGYTRPINPQNAPSNFGSSATYPGKRRPQAAPVRPMTGPVRPIHGSSRAPDDL